MANLVNFLDLETNEVLNRLRKYGEAWVVGGWLRDVLLEGPIEGNKIDIDIATSLIPERVKEIFPKSIGVGENFGTIGVRLDSSKNRVWEVTTLRTDQNYSDGRRPDAVDFGVTILEDLARRDFTINAMALDRNGKIIDPYDGKGDIINSIIRAVGNPSERIQEDGLRILRAFRFMDSGERGIRKLDVSLSNSIIENINSLGNISKERIGSEFLKILSGMYIDEIINSMNQHGIFGSILPEVNINNSHNYTNNKIINLALICSKSDMSGWELGRYLMNELRISKEESKMIAILHECRGIDVDSSIESARRFVAFHREERRMMIIDYLKSLGRDLDDFSSIIDSLKSVESKLPLIDGNRLSQLTGLKPGKRLGKLKDWLYRKQIEEDIKQAEELSNFLDEMDWKNSEPDDWDGMYWP